MTLDHEDIQAIADAVVLRMRAAEDMQMDEAFMVSLPPAERKRRARKEMKRQDDARKKRSQA